MAVVRKTGRNADQMVEKVAKDAEKIGQLVEQLSTAVKDLREGKGTLGKLMADPELHDALLALVENLNQVSKETERLLVRWRKEGILSKEK
jgi:ABC-type transporter Mla subunit MlaD